MLHPKIFFWIAASVADASAVNPNDIKTLLVHGFSTFFIKGKRLFSNGSKSLPRNLPDCLENYILADELFVQVIPSLQTCVLVDNLCRKLLSSLLSPIRFDERFKVAPISFLFPILIY